jgi:hypothetical protein
MKNRLRRWICSLPNHILTVSAASASTCPEQLRKSYSLKWDDKNMAKWYNEKAEENEQERK